MCVGFLMKCHKGDVLGQSVLVPNIIKNKMDWTRIELTTLASVILKRFICLHKVGIFMADINPGNIIIDGISAPFFIDVDSYQVEDYPCQVCRIEFISQRLVSEMGNANVIREKEDEYYAIAVLLFMIFLVGKHPYTKRGKGSMEKNLRDRNFIYPVGYDDDTHIPHGPYQRIWYNLPLNMRQAFYLVFHEGKLLSPIEWLVIINSYQKDLKANRYPREIFPDSENSKGSGVCLELTPQEQISNTNEILRSFDNDLNVKTKGNHYAFLEFGSNSFRGYDSRGKKVALGERVIKTNHFKFVDQFGKMNTKQLTNALLQPKCLPDWLSYIKSFSPKYNHIYAFGGSFLRNLTNREEVIMEIRKVTNISIGILSLDEEVEALVDECNKHIEKKSFLLVDVGGTATRLLLKDEGKKVISNEFFKLGRLVLHNRFFNTAFSDSRLLTMIEEHDKIISEQLGKYTINSNHSMKLIGGGIVNKLSDVMVYVEMKDHYTLDELEEINDKLTEELTLNRTFASSLYDDINQSTNDSLSNKTDLRLCLPIYIDLMKKLNFEKIYILPNRLGKIIASNINNKFEQL